MASETSAPSPSETTSEREAAKKAVVSVDNDDPELDAALANASKHQLDLKKEDNRHKETMNKQNLGFVGNILGDGRNTATTAAIMVIIFSFVLSLILYVAAFNQPETKEIWMTNAERAFAAGIAALAYVFGKGGSK
ncbi:hypothetical protein ABWH98_09665 [Labrenzia sp. ac12]